MGLERRGEEERTLRPGQSEQGLGGTNMCSTHGVSQVDELSPRESLEREVSRWERTEHWKAPNPVG